MYGRVITEKYVCVMLWSSRHGMMCPDLQGLVLCLLALHHGPGVLYDYIKQQTSLIRYIRLMPPTKCHQV